MPASDASDVRDVPFLRTVLQFLAWTSLGSTAYLANAAWLSGTPHVWYLAALSGFVAAAAAGASRMVDRSLRWAVTLAAGVAAAAGVLAAVLAPALAPAAILGGIALLAFAVAIPPKDLRRVIQAAGIFTSLAGVFLMARQGGAALPIALWLPVTLALLALVVLTTAGVRSLVEQRHEAAATARAEAAAFDARAQAFEDALRERAAFHAALQHELRAPLQGILFAVDQYRAGGPGDAERLQSSALHLASLLDDLMDVSSIDAGHWQIRDEDFDPRTAVTDAVDIVSGLAASNQTRIDVSMQELAPAYRGDVRRLRQVAINLVGNAVRHAPDGMVQVALTETDGGLLLRVDDDGPGFNEPALLHAFRQGSRPGARGLGLHVVNSIAAAIGGGVELGRSSMGGARVEVRWPTKRARNRGEGDLSGMHVLVCDDDVMMARLAEEVLGQAGARCTVTGRVQEAIAALQGMPDVVLMDMHLPDGRGDAILGPAQAFRARVLFLTGAPDPAEAEALLQRGAAGVLEKPCLPEALVAHVAGARTLA